MNEKHPTQEHLSFYYDGILSSEEKTAVEIHLQGCESCRTVLQSFTLFDTALQADLSESEINRLLGNTVQEVHTRILENERRLRVHTEPFWGWILAPQYILAGLAVLLLICGIVTTLSTEKVRSFFAGNPKNEPIIVDEFNPEKWNSKEPIITTAQREGIILAARFAKNTVSSGIQYAKAKGNRWEETLSSLKEETGKALAFAAIPTPKTETQPQNSSGESAPNTPVEALKQVGRQQMQLGMGASILGLLTVF